MINASNLCNITQYEEAVNVAKILRKQRNDTGGNGSAPPKGKPFTSISRSWDLFLLLLPAVVLLLVFSYGPLYGVLMAFQDYSAVRGVFGSKWVGLKHFTRFVTANNFTGLLRNTLTISIYSLAAGFPLPIILALLLNKLKNQKFKGFVQTASYAPYFISTVVLVGMMRIFFTPETGIFNHLIMAFGGQDFDYFASGPAFKHLYVWSDVWKNIGWGSIIYVAALSNINPELYESAKVDGASAMKTIWHIDLPGILPTVITLLILNTGNLMSVGFEKAYLMQTTLNTEFSEIISTYVYKVGIKGAQFSFSTAVNTFNSVINCVLLIVVNKVARATGETSLW